jgi:phospholipid-binding lipoprotein MlaA
MGEWIPGARVWPAGPLHAIGTLILAVLSLGLVACASVDTRTSLADKDRFEDFNRASYNVQDRLDRSVIRPIARGYDSLPEKIQGRVSNFFDNLRGPVDISNNLLQGKLKRGFSGIGRLLVNSTVGLGGLFDPATRMGLPRHPEDFGQTLAVYGVPSGPYIYLPVIGPSTARDLVGRIFDWQIDPLLQHDDTSTRNSLFVLDKIDSRSEFLSAATEGALERSDDEYIEVRSEYDTTRQNQICDCEQTEFLDFD